MDISGKKNKNKGIELLSRSEISEIFEIFKKKNPAPKSELTAPNNYTFLVSVVLSAQSTDKSVNKATKELYEKIKTPEEMLGLGEEKLLDYIKSIGLYKSKGKHIIQLSRILTEKFGGSIPETFEDLISLPGVGRKTANVILNSVYKKPTMPVDTHILRISPRIGLATGNTPEKVEKELLEIIPEQYLLNAHHWLILHGRYICTAKKPDCSNCPIERLCKKNNL